MSSLNRVFRYSNLDPQIDVEDPLVEGGDDWAQGGAGTVPLCLVNR